MDIRKSQLVKVETFVLLGRGGFATPTGLPVYPPDVGWVNYREGRPESRPSYIRGKLFIISRHHDGDSMVVFSKLIPTQYIDSRCLP